MCRRLFIVEETFTVKSRGIALLPGVTKDDRDLHRKVGLLIELRRPDGSVLTTTIQAIEWFQTPSMPTAPLHLPTDVSKDDVPVGTEVWLTR